MSGTDLRTEARAAWLYASPLIEMAALRIRMFDAASPGLKAGSNRLVHMQRLVEPSEREVTTPNNDTLYSCAFIDLTRGPVTLEVPDARGRYLSVAILDMYTNNNAVIGARSPGGAAGLYRLVGPQDASASPNDIEVLTPHAWVLARILVEGAEDLAAAQAVQAQLKVSGPEVAAPASYAERAADWTTYFQSALALMASDPPPADAAESPVEILRRAGSTGDFSRRGYSAADLAEIDAGVAEADALVRGATNKARYIDGWSYPKSNIGVFGDDYATRAMVAVAGIGALPMSEAMYLRAQAQDGTALFDDEETYRFSLPEPLPLDGFWSLTMYEATADGQFFLTENSLNRYAIGDRTAGLQTTPAGGVDIWIARKDPGGERTANWLPAPRRGPYSLFLRLYLPSEALQARVYRIPRVVRAEG